MTGPTPTNEEVDVDDAEDGLSSDEAREEPDEEDEGPYKSPLEGPGHLIVAAERVQEISTWATGTIVAAAGAVLAATPLITGFEYETTWPALARWFLAALAAAVAGIVAVWIIQELARSRHPLITTLDDLDPAFVKRIEASPRTYLPDDKEKLVDFRAGLRDWQIAAEHHRWQAKRSPDDAEAQWIAAWARAQADTYLRARDRIVLEGGLRAKLTQSGFRREVYLGTALIAAGLTTYIVLLAGNEPKKDKDEATTGAPSAAVLIQHPPVYNEVLTGCGTVDATGQSETDKADNSDDPRPAEDRLGVDGIPVLLAGGSGTDADPWKLQTFGPSPGCPAVTITGTIAEGFDIVIVGQNIVVTTTTTEP